MELASETILFMESWLLHDMATVVRVTTHKSQLDVFIWVTLIIAWLKLAQVPLHHKFIISIVLFLFRDVTEIIGEFKAF